MSELLKSFIESVLFNAIISGGVASLITYWLSRRQFIQEQWWGRKADAYAEIIASLVALVHSLERWRGYELDEYQGLEPPSQKAKEDLEKARSEYQESKTWIKRTVYQGDYIVSKNAAETLEELTKQLEKRPWGDDPHSWLDWIDYLGMQFVAVQDCLQVVRDEARSDLRLGRDAKRIKRRGRRTK